MKAIEVLCLRREGYSKKEIDDMSEEEVSMTVDLIGAGYTREEIAEMEWE